MESSSFWTSGIARGATKATGGVTGTEVIGEKTESSLIMGEFSTVLGHSSEESFSDTDVLAMSASESWNGLSSLEVEAAQFSVETLEISNAGSVPRSWSPEVSVLPDIIGPTDTGEALKTVVANLCAISLLLSLTWLQFGSQSAIEACRLIGKWPLDEGLQGDLESGSDRRWDEFGNWLFEIVWHTITIWSIFLSKVESCKENLNLIVGKIINVEHIWILNKMMVFRISVLVTFLRKGNVGDKNYLLLYSVKPCSYCHWFHVTRFVNAS